MIMFIQCLLFQPLISRIDRTQSRMLIKKKNHSFRISYFGCNAYFNLGFNYGRKGELKEALPVYRECLERSSLLLGADHPKTLIRSKKVDCMRLLKLTMAN